MADIKQIIDDNIYQNGQQRITGIVMNSVLKAMVDDTDEKVGDLAEKTIEDSNSDKIEIKVNAIMSCLAELVTKIVFHSGVPYQLPSELRNALALTKYSTPSARAICGECVCGEVICGQL